MKHFFLLFLLVSGLWLSGCRSGQSQITHLPFKADEDDRWGMIGIDGKVLFENEFQERPSVVIHGIFTVKNAEGLYEYYTAETRPKPLNDKAYITAGAFLEDIAPVVEPEQPISYIRKDGTTAFTLDKYRNRRIVCAVPFSEGLAGFKTQDERFGFIDTQGKVVIEPHFTSIHSFSEGLAVVEQADSTWIVINKKGEKQFALPKNTTGFYFSDGLLACWKTSEETSYPANVDFFLDTKGDKVLTVPDKVKVARFSTFSHGYIPCYQEDKEKNVYYVGLMNKKGEIVIRPKYEVEYAYEISNFLITDNNLLCVTDHEKMGLVDMENNLVCPIEFSQLLPTLDSRYAFAKQGNYWRIIHQKGGKKATAVEYAMIGGSPYSEYFESDWIDGEGFAQDLLKPLGANGYGSILFGKTIAHIADDHNMDAEDCLDYSDALVLPADKLNEYSDLSLVLVSATNVFTPIVKSRRRHFWLWETETVGYKFNPKARVDMIVVIVQPRDSFVSNISKRLYEAVIQYMDSHFKRIDDAQKDAPKSATDSESKQSITYQTQIDGTPVKVTVTAIGKLLAEENEFTLVIEPAE